MSQTYTELLRTSAKKNSIISAGYDPAPVDFPQEGISGYDEQLPSPDSQYDGQAVEHTISSYFFEFVEEMKNRGVAPGAFKPNLGYFRMFDNEEGRWGLNALDAVLDEMNELVDVPNIWDVKDADIGRSSAAYGTSKLKKDGVDAITVHPYMGIDSVEPFFQLAEENGQGVYILTRTTNPGAGDFQDLEVSGQPLYLRVADKIVDWSQEYPGGTVASVAAGNHIDELEEIASRFAEADAEIPLLIPGVGTQGGKAGEVIETLVDVGYDPRLARINSSSGIMYRAQKDGRPREEHAEASVDELRALNQETELEQFLE